MKRLYDERREIDKKKCKPFRWGNKNEKIDYSDNNIAISNCKEDNDNPILILILINYVSMIRFGN